ncbi:MAG: MATE family efflux transporter [Theionarchaea archaeon]|nr:MATE family efflux transporter [Theionarchaea archaeon]MBU6999403.1 MATE family efflux transporter [Theionarchaea archaeon]MBU7021330.1 MATE family efflux transporter [Theionarchaea archaeon]
MGDPKKAIIRLSLPMMVAMSIQTIYNIVDAIWVSGLGADALSAVGFFFPFFFMMNAIATGIGIGGGSAISRRIGAKDKKGADTVASHTIVIMLLAAVAFAVPFFIFARDIFSAMGAGDITDSATQYGQVIIAGIVVIFFSSVANALLRGEGDATRSMYALMSGAVLNILLDPLFIYTFRMGVAGAAVATVLSMTLASFILFNWIFIKKDTYVSISLHGFRFRKDVIGEIVKVGLPSAISQLSMSLTMLFLNVIVVKAGGTDGVAVFTTGWRVATFASLPLMGIATAVTAVTGAAFGSRDYRKLDTAYLYAVKIGVMIELVVATATYGFAPQITMLFTLSQDAARISQDLITFLRVMCFYYPVVSWGMLSSAMFQGTGRGTSALIMTVFRTIVLTAPLAFTFSLVLGMGLRGVWWGIVAGNVTGATSAFAWGRLYVQGLKKKSEDPPG